MVKGKLVKKSTSLMLSFALLIALFSVINVQASGAINLALGKAYTYSAFDPLHPDYAFVSPDHEDTDGKELTDGKYANPTAWSDAAWTGWNGWKNTTTDTITIDLGKVVAVEEIVSNYYNVVEDGFAPPKSMKVSLSSDKNTWSQIAAETDAVKIKKLNLGAKYKARYVKLEFVHGNSWMDFDEIEVLGYDDLTGAIDPDVNATKNLVANLNYTFTPYDPRYPDYVWSFGMEDTGGKELTDGIYGDADNYGDAAWSGFNGWNGGLTSSTIQFDLGDLKAIKTVKTSFFMNEKDGITPPRMLNIYLSSDNVNWTKVMIEKESLKIRTVNFKDAYKARYIKIELYHNTGWMILDEIEVVGTNNTSEAVDPVEFVPGEPEKPVEKPEKPREETSVEQRFPAGKDIKTGYMKPGEHTAGINDLVLLYNQYYKDGTGDFTAEKIRPYLTYIDREGKAVDSMFEGVLFLALNSNRSQMIADILVERSFYTDSLPCEKVDYDWYLNKTFGANGDMAALNQAATQAAIDLKNSNYKAKVVVMVPRPSSKVKDFGGGFGDMSVVANQKAVMTWYMNEVLSRFNNGNFNYVELAGLYWLDESIGGNNNDVVDTFVQFCHTNNLKTFWIPYYDASGATDGTWKTVGMDAVAYQPNHYFTDTGNPERITIAASQAASIGMGVEIENGPDIMKDWDCFERHMDYLDGSVLYGYQGENSYRAHYQWVLGYQMMSNPTISNSKYTIGTSNYERGRRGYEDLYKMMKGTLKLSNRKIVLAPEVQSANSNTVTLKPIEGYEYSSDFINWTKSNVFTGLESGKEYTFYQRVAGTETHEPSLASTGLKVSTEKTVETSMNIELKVTHQYGDIEDVTETYTMERYDTISVEKFINTKNGVYKLVSISPDKNFTLTDYNNKITITYEKVTQKNEIPNTGDKTLLIVPILLLFASVTTIVVTKKKKML